MAYKRNKEKVMDLEKVYPVKVKMLNDKYRRNEIIVEDNI